MIRPFARMSDAIALMGDQYMLFVGICFVAMLLGSLVPFYVLFGPMFAGIHICFNHRAVGGVTKFDHLFKGFDFFLPTFFAILIVIVLVLLVVLPLFGALALAFGVVVSSAEGNDEFIGAAMLFGFLPTIILLSIASMMIYVPFLFTFALIVDRRMQAWEAIQLSWSGAKKNFWGLTGCLFAFWFLSILSAMMCYIPLFFLIPVQFGVLYLVYRDIFPNVQPNTVIPAIAHSA